MGPEPHIPDEELVLALDGELDEPRAAAVQRHLSHCWDCRSRHARLEQAIAEYLTVHQAAATVAIPPVAGPAAKLRATLRQQAVPEPRWRWAWLRATPSVLAGSIAVLLVPLALILWMGWDAAAPAGPLPNGRLTPGAVRLISAEQVCAVPPLDEGHMASAQLAALVFEQYRIANPKPGSFEVDYLISPSLGGSNDIRNLWPVPYAEGVWTSRVKDALEDQLRTLVCDGKLDLATAQREISADWIAAYRKYFKTRRPIASHALFFKDSPWE